MPRFAATLPTCVACHAFLTADEQEVNLRVISALLAMRWPRPICNFTRIVDSWPFLVIVVRVIPYAAHGHGVEEVERLRHATGSQAGTMSARTARSPLACRAASTGPSGQYDATLLAMPVATPPGLLGALGTPPVDLPPGPAAGGAPAGSDG